MKLKLLITTSIIACVAMSSCKKFLDQEPQTKLTADQMSSSLSNIEQLILGNYTDWRNFRQDRQGFRFQLGSDESRQGNFQVMGDADQGALDKYDGYLSATNNGVTAEWNRRWPVVGSAANSIYMLKLDTTDAARRNELLAEASCIRAAVMFELTQYWGSVPVMDYFRTDSLKTKRQPLNVVYEQIVSDLTFATQYLPETQNNKSRVTKYVAWALLGKVYMNAPQESTYKDMQKAANCFNTIIQSGKYALVNNYADLFDPIKPNSIESIYEFQFNDAQPDNNMTQWQMGSRAVAQLDPDHHIGEYCYFGGYDLMMPTPYCYNTVENGGIWENGDTRKAASIRYDFTYKGYTPTIDGWMGQDELDPHVKKYEDIRTDGITSFWLSGKNIFYIRYSDVLLSYAECLNELGNAADAVNIVNQVRTRAFGGTLPPTMRWNVMSQDQFRTKILDERMRELCFEGWRRIDLKRTGNFVNYIKTRNKWAAQSGTIQSFHQLYPIPSTEIMLNESMTKADQNPGYN